MLEKKQRKKEIKMKFDRIDIPRMESQRYKAIENILNLMF